MSGAAGTPPAPTGGRWRSHRRVVPRTIQAPPPPSGTFIFRDLNPGERIIWIRRQSYLFLLATAAPVLLLGLGLFLLDALLGANVANVVHVIGLALLAVLGVYWLIANLWPWFFQFYVLTNQRVVRSTGFFFRHRGEIGLKTIAQVRVERPNVFYIALGIGNVIVRPIGPELELTGLAHPRDVGDSILAAIDDPNFGLPAAAVPAAPQAPPIKSPKLQAALDDLAHPVAMPAVSPPIMPTPPFSFLHRKIPMRFLQGEEIVEVVYRHWAILLRDEIPALILLLAGIIGSILLSRTGGDLAPWVLVGGIVFGGMIGLLLYLNWADDVFILTNQRVIDIDRLAFILAEYSKDAPYARIQEVNVNRNVLGKLLGFGSIVVDTAGRKSPLAMEHIPHAFRVMDRIFEQINLLRERDQVQAANRQKKENLLWMATVLNDLQITVPDLHGRSVVAAAAEARKAGLKLTVEQERPVPGQPPGTVIEQRPSAGTTALADAEVRVILAGRPVGAVP